MFDKESLETLMQAEAISAANSAAIDSIADQGVIALPEDFKTHDLESYMPKRRRARGTMTTVNDDDFAAYVKAHQEPGVAVFVDEKAMTATAILNLGTPEKPGHTDNRAVLAPPKTAAYAALLAIANGQGQSQKTIAEFLEDWQPAIECKGSNDNIPVPKAVAAMRKLTIEQLRKQTTEEQSLSGSRSTFDSIMASSEEPIPVTVSFKCIPHVGMNERVFTMRLGIRTGDNAPQPVLRIVKQEEHNEQMGKELAERVRQKLNGITVAVGTYASK